MIEDMIAQLVAAEKLNSLAREQGEATRDTELLRRTTVKISVAQTSSEAEQYLLALTRDDKRN